MSNNEPISERWYRAASNWVELEAAADLLESTKSSVFSQMVNQSERHSIAAKEVEVRAGDAWITHVRKIAAARKAANLAKIECEYLKMQMQEWISADANHRLQAKL